MGRRQRPVLEAARGEEPAATVGLEREWIRAGVEVDADAVRFWRGVGSLGLGKVRPVEARPLILRGVPPDVFLPLGPRLALRVSRRPVVVAAALPGARYS